MRREVLVAIVHQHRHDELPGSPLTAAANVATVVGFGMVADAKTLGAIGRQWVLADASCAAKCYGPARGSTVVEPVAGAGVATSPPVVGVTLAVAVRPIVNVGTVAAVPLESWASSYFS